MHVASGVLAAREGAVLGLLQAESKLGVLRHLGRLRRLLVGAPLVQIHDRGGVPVEIGGDIGRESSSRLADEQFSHLLQPLNHTLMA
jgi:hypothetical protein